MAVKLYVAGATCKETTAFCVTEAGRLSRGETPRRKYCVEQEISLGGRYRVGGLGLRLGVASLGLCVSGLELGVWGFGV